MAPLWCSVFFFFFLTPSGFTISLWKLHDNTAAWSCDAPPHLRASPRQPAVVAWDAGAKVWYMRLVQGNGIYGWCKVYAACARHIQSPYEGCEGCERCEGCEGCTACTDRTDRTDCTDCTDHVCNHGWTSLAVDTSHVACETHPGPEMRGSEGALRPIRQMIRPSCVGREAFAKAHVVIDQYPMTESLARSFSFLPY